MDVYLKRTFTKDDDNVILIETRGDFSSLFDKDTNVFFVVKWKVSPSKSVYGMPVGMLRDGMISYIANDYLRLWERDLHRVHVLFMHVNEMLDEIFSEDRPYALEGVAFEIERILTNEGKT